MQSLVKLFDSLTRPELWNAFVLSLVSATISTSLLALFGIPLAYFLARYTGFRGKFVIRVIVIIPLVLPPLASGALLLGVFGPNSPLVQYFPGVEFTQSSTWSHYSSNLCCITIYDSCKSGSI